MDPLRLLVFVHVLADLVWIGSILAVAVVLASREAGAAERGRLARLVYRRLAAPAFGVAFLTGVLRLGLSPELYLELSHWMHAKLPVALGLIALHHVLGARVKRVEAGEESAGAPATVLGWSLLACAAVATALAVLKPF